MIEASPFVVLATVGPEGLDCSPRGDKGQVAFIENETRLLLPDWRGNNRVDSLSNVVRDARLALLFLVPGSDNALRVNGRGVVAIDPELKARFEKDGKQPKSILVIDIEEVYFQCARAIMRANLWGDAASHPVDAPTAGEMLREANPDFDSEAYDKNWPGRASKSMW